MRYYQMFKTQEECRAWEKEMALKNREFRVCMRMTAKQIEKELGFVNKSGYTIATIYTFD